MLKSNAWWRCQLIEMMCEASGLYDRFKGAHQSNVEDLDNSMIICEECCWVYDLKEIRFEEFIDFWTSLRARWALSNTHKAYDHG